MSVAPDLLLQLGPELKARPAAKRIPEKTAEPVKREPSSFDQVYARERQAKAAERSEGAAKTARSEQRQERDEPVEAAAGSEQASQVAESGNALPAEAESVVVAEQTDAESLSSEEPVVDPLLLLGLPLSETPVDTAELDGSTAPALGDLLGQSQAESASDLTELEEAPDSAAESVLSGLEAQLQLAMNAEQVAAVLPQQASVVAQATKSSELSGREFGQAISALASGKGDAQNAEAGAGSLDQEALLEVDMQQLEGSELVGELRKDASAELRNDSFAGKLSMLSQAIAQQTGQSQRSVLVPGQPVAMQQGGWSEAVVDRVMWLSSQNLKSAEIQLDPAELGRLDVRIQMTQDQTQVTFASPHAGVREALEGQMQRLRDLFTQQGMNLLDVNVSDQSLNRGWQGQGGDGERRGGGQGAAQGLASESEVSHGVIELRSPSARAGLGLVDYYA